MTKLLSGALTICFGLAILTTVPAAIAQSTSTAQINGVVQDQSGAVVPNAQITVTEIDTGTVHTTTSNATGVYTVAQLPVGHYNLQVSAPGFQTYVQRNLTLDVDTAPKIDVKLSVGAVTQQVVVESTNAEVETESTGVGQVIGAEQIVDLPLNGRDPDQLITLSGAVTAAPAGDLNSNKNFPTITLSVAGGLPDMVAFILDGGTHNEATNNLNMPQPQPDALQEFKVDTSSLPAQYGDHATAAINAVTKSGTNKFHGDVYEFIRNYYVDAAGFFTNLTQTPHKDGLKRNQFGGVLGGPIKRDKMFFFVGYEGTVQSTVSNSTYTQVPTIAMLNGDFSQITSEGTSGCSSDTAPINMSAPFTATGSPDGRRDQFPGGIGAAPAGVQAALKQIPVAVPAGYTGTVPAGYTALPDVTATATNGAHTGNCGYIGVKLPALQKQGNYIGRVDYTINKKDSVFGRWAMGINKQPIPATPNDVLNQNNTGVYNRDQSLTVGDTYILTQSLINNVRLTVNRIINQRVVDPSVDPAELGIGTYNTIPGYMSLTVTGGFSLGGGAENPGYFDSTSWQFVDDVTYLHGAHQFAFGVDYIYSLMDTVNNRLAGANAGFTGSLTSYTTNGLSGTALTSCQAAPGPPVGLPPNNANTPNPNCATGGIGYADLFAGYLGSFVQGSHDLENDGQTDFGLYAQDAWKPTKRLTLNYGIRWEPYTPEHNTNDHTENWTLAGYEAGTVSSVYPQAPPGLQFGGDAGMPGNHYTYGKLGNFEPRVGIISDPFGDGKTSLRAGFGMFWDSPQMFFDTRYSNSPPYGQTVTPTLGTFANPWLNYSGGDPFPAAIYPTKTTPFVSQGTYVNTPLHVQPPYIEQWNVSAQRQVRSWLFSAAYVGNRTIHLPTSTENNPYVFIPGQCTAGQYGLTKAGQCSQSTSGANATNRRFLYLYNNPTGATLANGAPGTMYNTIAQYDDGGVSDYNGMLISVNHRAKLVSILANYTFARCLSETETTELTGPSYVLNPMFVPNARRYSYSNCDSAHRQAVNSSIILNMPHFPTHHLLDLIASNWSESTIFTATTGGYFSISNPTDYTYTGTTEYAYNPPASQIHGVRTNFGMYNYFQPATNWTSLPANQAVETVDGGNFSLARPLTLVAPSSYELDMRLSRTFTVHEAQRLQINFEAFNVPNSVAVGTPTTTLTSSTFGQFTSQSNSPRILQASAKFIF